MLVPVINAKVTLEGPTELTVQKVLGPMQVVVQPLDGGAVVVQPVRGLVTVDASQVAGNRGADGASAYQIWLDAGNTGTEADFLASLEGEPGADSTIPGPQGASAYAAWLALGNVGSEADFIASLVGAKGDVGDAGPIGATGIQGSPGSNGVDGKTVLSDTGVPSNGLGTNGDFYLDTAASRLYGPKTSGAWGSGVTLVGATGSAGAAGPSNIITESSGPTDLTVGGITNGFLLIRSGTTV
jgi:hypothetical protein